MDYTEGALSALKNDKFVQYIGVELLSASEGRATGRMVIQDFHLNGVGSVQGGALYTLADYVVAAAAKSRGKTAVSLDGPYVSVDSYTPHAAHVGDNTDLSITILLKSI